MSHKTRAEQFEVKARKDPKGLAYKTKRHSSKSEYKRLKIQTREVQIDETTTRS